MRLWRDRLVRNTFLATALAVAVILWAKQELGLETDVLLGYLAGSALLVITTGTVFKLHVHTNRPDAVIRAAGRLGAVEERKVDDMLRQRDERSARRANAANAQPCVRTCAPWCARQCHRGGRRAEPRPHELPAGCTSEF